MKRIEIIIPDAKLVDAHEILKDFNSTGMSAYAVKGSGTIKSERITFGRVTVQTQPECARNRSVDRLGPDW
jgi:nitrogen regulatory protein PII